MRKVTNITAATVVVLIAAAVAASAYANTQSGAQPHTFGRPGTAPRLAANCNHLPEDTTPWGRTWLDGGKQAVSQGFTWTQAGLKCANRRENRVMHCFDQPAIQIPPAPVEKQDHGAGKPGDWSGLTGVYQALAAEIQQQEAIKACVVSVTGNRS